MCRLCFYLDLCLHVIYSHRNLDWMVLCTAQSIWVQIGRVEKAIRDTSLSWGLCLSHGCSASQPKQLIKWQNTHTLFFLSRDSHPASFSAHKRIHKKGVFSNCMVLLKNYKVKIQNFHQHHCCDFMSNYNKITGYGVSLKSAAMNTSN